MVSFDVCQRSLIQLKCIIGVSLCFVPDIACAVIAVGNVIEGEKDDAF